MDLLRAFFLGTVQGLTEFIPISSSAHLIIIPWLLKWNNPTLTSLYFDVALHLGTLVAVVWFFAKDWGRLIRAGLASVIEHRIGADADRKLVWFLVIGCIPGGVAGVLCESKIDQWFHQPGVPPTMIAMIVMAIIIASLALALFVTERSARHTREMNALSLKDALIIGLAQAYAIFPGVSRSGSTITAGLALGLRRDVAARFSFLLGTPIIFGAGLMSLWNLYQQFHVGGPLTLADLVLFTVGCLAAAISGYLSIKCLLSYLQRNSTDVFVIYRLILAAFVIGVVLVRG